MDTQFLKYNKRKIKLTRFINLSILYIFFYFNLSVYIYLFYICDLHSHDKCLKILQTYVKLLFLFQLIVRFIRTIYV